MISAEEEKKVTIFMRIYASGRKFYFLMEGFRPVLLKVTAIKKKKPPVIEGAEDIADYIAWVKVREITSC